MNVELKYLDLYSSDLNRKNFDAFIQGWCLSASSYPVAFQVPLYPATRQKLREKMKTVKQETLDILIKLFIANKSAMSSSLVALLDYLPQLTQANIDWLWEAEYYSVLKEYYIGYKSADRTPEERETFQQKLVSICLLYEPHTNSLTIDYTLKTVAETYICNAKTPEQFQFLFSLYNPTITKRILRNSDCPVRFMEEYQDKSEYVKDILDNYRVPPEIAISIISKFNFPVTADRVQTILRSMTVSHGVVVTVRPATEEDRVNGLTLYQKNALWNSTLHKGE